MKTKISLNGLELHADSINVLRGLLMDSIAQDTKLTKFPNPYDVISDWYDHRARVFYLLTVIDGVPYRPRSPESDTFSIFIDGKLLSDEDSIIIGHALQRYELGGASSLALEVSGFMIKHFRNLLTPMIEKVVPLIPRDPEDDEPIPD